MVKSYLNEHILCEKVNYLEVRTVYIQAVQVHMNSSSSTMHSNVTIRVTVYIHVYRKMWEESLGTEHEKWKNYSSFVSAAAV